MYKTKKEVDAHVRTALSKLRSESERHLRSFTIAKLYYKINEYAAAEQYLCSYLSVKEDNDQAHKLLGQCYQRQRKSEKALQSYQRSLQLNAKQPEVLAEVCQLLIADKNLNLNKAKYWCELAESEKVQHDAVFSLRLKLINKDSLKTNQVEELIQKEIAARPHDVALRVRLVRNHLEQNKVLDAFKYVYQLQMQHADAYVASSEWYNMVWLVLSKYEQLPNVKKDWEFWLLLAICLERQVYISFSHSTSLSGGLSSSSSAAVGISSSGGCTETANLLFNLDQYLCKIAQIADQLTGVQRELVTVFLDHYRGQLLLHSASLIFKRELLQNKNKWKETVKAVLPLLLLAFQVDAPQPNREPWMKHCDEQGKQLVQLWNREGAFRCAQVGRTLLSCIADETGSKENNAALQMNTMVGNQPTLWNNCDELLAQIRQTCSDKQWRHNIFALLFCNSDQKVKEQSSLLITSVACTEPNYELPSYADIERYEETAQYLRPQSLQHIVYLCLGNDNLAYVRAKYFSGLNFSTQNLSFCGAESLNQLDVETFLYAAAISAKRALEVDRDAFDNYTSGNRSAAGRPRLLPFVNLQGQLCSEEQATWWNAAYQVYKNLSSDNLAELRANLQYGIEAVRGINGPKIDLIIVFKLGQLFVARAQDIVKPIEKAFLEARAENIYKYGLNMLKMHNKGVLEPFRKYFKYPKANTSAVEREVASFAEDAVSYLAARYFKKAEYEDLIEELAGIQLPFATYLQAEAYRKLDEANKTPKNTKRMFLDRASECLNQTLSLLKSTQADPNHPLNSVIHAELKRMQHNSTKFLNDSGANNDTYSSPATGAAHNNSSTYEDAETDFFLANMSTLPPPSNSRTRRESAASALIASPRNTEMENLVKQMANTLSFVKDEIVDNIKPEVLSMRKEITSLKDKISQLEDAMKKTRISTTTSNPPSRDDDASNVLDDLYLIEDAIQSQLYQQQQSSSSAGNAASQFATNGPAGGAISSPFAPLPPHQQQQQQQRIHTPNAMQMQQNAAAVAAAAAAYGSPLFNPNFPMHPYYTSPYMMPPQGAPGANPMLGPRNPYLDASGALNFNLSAQTPLLPQPNQDVRSSNLYSLLNQQPNTPQMPQYSAAMSMPNMQQMQPTLTTSIAPVAQPQQPTAAVLAQPPPPPALQQQQPQQPMPQLAQPLPQLAQPLPQLAQPLPQLAQPVPVQFNKLLNNQPVEKGPPANVVITSSDPLPKPKSVAAQMQQPPLSVTIPSHHIKPSIVQEPLPLTTATGLTFGSAAAGGSPFTDFASLSNAASTATSTADSTVSSLFGNAKPIAVSSSSSCSSTTTSSKVSIPAAIATSTFSFKPQVAEAAKASAAAAAAEAALNKTGESVASELNRSDPEAEYDPRPDFKPIIPLPDEIEVKTGEEDEEIMFCFRAKLYRYADKEWKERGIGNIKILKNKDGSSRIIMRRDQTHKICANHKITKELSLSTPNNESKGHIWVANDFADEDLKLERFFVRFKLPETAKQFADAFRHARKEAEELEKHKDNKAQQMAPPAAPAPTTAPTIAAVAPFGLAKSGALTNFATSTPSTKGDSAGGLLAKPAIAPQIPKASSTSSSSGGLVTSTTTTSNVSKTLFGGFSLPTSTTLTATNKTAAEANTKPASPFANFAFDKAQATSSTTAAGTVTTSTSNAASPFANIFSSLGKSTTSPFSTANVVSPFQVTPTSTIVAPAVGSATDANANKSNVSDNEDDYVPTAQFNPVIALPDLVEVSTGEENEIVLFEYRAKLLRFVKETSEWKERGLGNIKLLQDKNDANKVRLVMRREQVHKLCCNQRLYKDTHFQYAKNSQTAISWAGQDYSENELVTEMLTVRFKTAETCKQFYDAVLKAQANMSAEAEESNAKKQETADKAKETAAKEKNNAESKTTSKGFGDAFKPKVGSWSCEACYISNKADTLYCVACDTPKDDTVPKKAAPAVSSLLTTTGKSTFTFGFGAAPTAPAAPAATATPAAKTTNSVDDIIASVSSGAAFSFNTPAAPTPAAVSPFTASSATTQTTNAKVSTTTSTVVGFGDKFKPKVGSWNCQECYLSNAGDAIYCNACDAPKDATVPKKEAAAAANNVLAMSNPAAKFNFGFAAAAAAAPTATVTPAAAAAPTVSNTTTSSNTNTEAAKPLTFAGFAAASQSSFFGSAAGDASKSTFTFTPPSATSTTLSAAALGKPTFSFSLPNKTEQTTPAVSEATASPAFSLDKKDFSFTLKPKSPGKVGKSPMKFGLGGGDADGGADDGDDGDYHEDEENNTHFTPVIPLPDKIEVKTGEEDEEVLYLHRAKLYRFFDKDWKERGIGDVKILRHKTTRKLRVVMRREQIWKICLNHVLNEDVEYKSKDDKSWLFVVNDFSEGTFELEKFSLRFKTKEIALAFMDAIGSALAGTAVAIEPTVVGAAGANISTTSLNSSTLNASTIANTAKATTTTTAAAATLDITDADKQTADRLLLPYEFFTAKPTCTGCRGCDVDQFVFPTPKSGSEAFVNKEDSADPLGPLDQPALTLPKARANTSFLKQSALSPAASIPTPSANTAAAAVVAAPTKTNENIFAGFGGANSTAFGAANSTTFGSAANLTTFGSVTDKTPVVVPPAANTTFSFAAALDSTTTASKPNETVTAGSGGFLFGNSLNSAGGGSLFGGDKKPIFGQTPTLFGKLGTTTTTNESASDKTKSIFGSTATTNAPTTTATTGGSIFGGATTFGGGGTSSIFGGGAAVKSDNDTKKSIFGNTAPAAPANTTPSSGGNGSGNSLFGNTATSFTGFGNKTAFAVGSGVGANTTNSPIFGGKKDESSSPAPVAPASFADLSNKSGGIDFASLAANASPNTPTLTRPKEKSTFATASFVGLTNENAFSSFLKPAGNSLSGTPKASSDAKDVDESSKSVDDDGSAANDENYDPHYEPIIALPNEIVVSTGEEEETKLYGERATLYRWDDTNKEWKERGVGELKLLVHKTNQTYRLVMRREQIHKLVLNHAVGADFVFNNMQSNPKSLVWATMNYAESTDGELEKLAVRFKKGELAQQFSDRLKECIEAAGKRLGAESKD